MENLELDDAILQKFKRLSADFSKAIPGDIRTRMVSIYGNEIEYEIVKTLYSHKEPVDIYTILNDLDSYFYQNNTSFVEFGKEFERLIDEKIITKEKRGPCDVVYSTNPLTNEAFRILKIVEKHYLKPILTEMKSEAELSDFSETDLNNIGKIGLILTLKDFE